MFNHSAAKEIQSLEQSLANRNKQVRELQAENKALREAAKMVAEVLHRDESELRLIYIAPEERAALAKLIKEKN